MHIFYPAFLKVKLSFNGAHIKNLPFQPFSITFTQYKTSQVTGLIQLGHFSGFRDHFHESSVSWWF